MSDWNSSEQRWLGRNRTGVAFRLPRARFGPRLQRKLFSSRGACLRDPLAPCTPITGWIGDGYQAYPLRHSELVDAARQDFRKLPLSIFCRPSAKGRLWAFRRAVGPLGVDGRRYKQELKRTDGRKKGEATKNSIGTKIRTPAT